MTDNPLAEQEALVPQYISVYKWHATRFPTPGSWCIAFSPDGKHVASASPTGVTVHVWETRSASLVAAYTGHHGRVNALAWTAYSGDDGKAIPAIASASDDRTVQVWEAFTGVQLFTHFHHAEVRVVASTLTETALIARGFPLVASEKIRAYLSLPESPLIASADDGGHIHVWCARDDVHPLMYTGHSGRVQSITFSPLPSAREGYFEEKTGYTGYLIASVAGGEEGTEAHIWLAQSGELCKIVGGGPSTGPVIWEPFAALEGGAFIFDGVRRFLEMPDTTLALKERTTLLSVNGRSPQLLSRDEEYVYVRTSGPPFRLVARFALPHEAHDSVLCVHTSERDACLFAVGTQQGAIMVYAMHWVDPKFAALCNQQDRS